MLDTNQHLPSQSIIAVTRPPSTRIFRGVKSACVNTILWPSRYSAYYLSRLVFYWTISPKKNLLTCCSKFNGLHSTTKRWPITLSLLRWVEVLTFRGNERFGSDFKTTLLLIHMTLRANNEWITGPSWSFGVSMSKSTFSARGRRDGEFDWLLKAIERNNTRGVIDIELGDVLSNKFIQLEILWKISIQNQRPAGARNGRRKRLSLLGIQSLPSPHTSQANGLPLKTSLYPEDISYKNTKSYGLYCYL